jgi:hypothetical protein
MDRAALVTTLMACLTGGAAIVGAGCRERAGAASPVADVWVPPGNGGARPGSTAAPDLDVHPSTPKVRVIFVGNDAVSAEDLLDVMACDKGPGEGTTEQDLVDRDLLYIDALYYDRGYLEVETKAVSVEPT